MDLRKQKLAQWIALQSAATVPNGNHEIAELKIYPVREPVSRRAYTSGPLTHEVGTDGLGRSGAGEFGRYGSRAIDCDRPSSDGVRDYHDESGSGSCDQRDDARYYDEGVLDAGLPASWWTDSVQS